MKDLNGKVVFITGAASGIGRACALELAREGCHIVVADLNMEGAKETVSQLLRIGVDAIAIQLDVANSEEFEKAAVDAIQWKGKVDVLINNAGFMMGGTFAETSLDQLKKITDVNVFGALHGIKAFEQHMKNNGQGQIVNVASLFGIMHLPFVSAYCMTKSALLALSNSLRYEMESDGVGVTVVCPGSISTELVNNGDWASSAAGGFIPDSFSQYSQTPPEKVAKEIVAGIKKNKPIVYAGMDAKIMSRLIRWMPALFRFSFSKLGKQTLNTSV